MIDKTFLRRNVNPHVLSILIEAQDFDVLSLNLITLMDVFILISCVKRLQQHSLLILTANHKVLSTEGVTFARSRISHVGMDLRFCLKCTPLRLESDLKIKLCFDDSLESLQSGSLPKKKCCLLLLILYSL